MHRRDPSMTKNPEDISGREGSTTLSYVISHSLHSTRRRSLTTGAAAAERRMQILRIPTRSSEAGYVRRTLANTRSNVDKSVQRSYIVACERDGGVGITPICKSYTRSRSVLLSDSYTTVIVHAQYQ